MAGHASASVLAGEWIPVSWCEDAPSEVRKPALGLRELLEHAHQISSIDITSPPALSALYRVLCALSARVTGLDREPSAESEGDWAEARVAVLTAGRFDPHAINGYFERYADRFGLFDPRFPFMQDPRLVEQCKKAAGVNKLVAGRPAGNNHSWFGGHHLDTKPVPVPRSQALLDLLTWSYYGASGKCSARTVEGVSDSNTKAGPLRSALSYHPVGQSLFETLVVGIPQPPDTLPDPDDPCPWERAELPDPRKPLEVRGVCSWLTGRSQHALLLVADCGEAAVVDAYITWAYRDAVLGPPHDPYLIMQWSKAGNLYARHADAGRALWRDLDSLQFHEQAGSQAPARPLVFTDLPRRGLRVQALGFDQDGQAKDTQFVAGITPPGFDASLLQEQGVNRLRIGELSAAAESVGSRLEYAAKKAWANYTNQKVTGCAWSQQAAARYWPAAEELFWARLLAENEDFTGLRRAFRKLAGPIYDEVTRGAAASLRGARAVEYARFELYGGRAKQSAPVKRKEVPVVAAEFTPSAEHVERRAFVNKVIAQCINPYHPEARAALRSGLGKTWDLIPHKVFRYVSDAGLPVTDDRYVLHAHYAVAAMIADTPKKAGLRPQPEQVWGLGRDLGTCLAEAVTHHALDHGAAERRLDLLVKQSTSGLHRHLPPLVGRLAERPGAVDWEQLLADLAHWQQDRNKISRRWLRNFYQTREYAAHNAAQERDDGDATGPATPA